MTSRERAEAVVVQADREMHITKPLTLAGFIQRAIDEAVAEEVKAEREAISLIVNTAAMPKSKVRFVCDYILDAIRARGAK